MPTLDEYRQRAAELEKQNNLPEGILWKISGIESSHRGDAVGPVTKSGESARGWFQFMPATAKQYGVTDPTDFNQSADGAARFLADVLKMHGGDVDRSLAYYNGGKPAVKALDAGKPWKETADYLRKFNGTPLQASMVPNPTTYPPMERVESDQPQIMGNSSQEAMQAAQVSKTRDGFGNSMVGLGKGLSAGIQQTSWYGLGENLINGGKADPNWTPTVGEFEEVLKDVPVEYHSKIINASVSSEDLAIRANRTKTLLDKTQEAASYGVPGYIGVMGGAMVDADMALSLAIPTLGAPLLTSTASRLTRAAEVGLVAAGTNYAFESATNNVKTLGLPEDKKYAALMGLYIAGPLGLFSKRGADPYAFKQEMAAQEAKRVEDQAFEDLIQLRKQEADIKGFDDMLTESGKAFKEKVDKDLAGWSAKFANDLERDTALYINTNFDSVPPVEIPPLFARGIDPGIRAGSGTPAYNHWFTNIANEYLDGEASVKGFLEINAARWSSEQDFLDSFTFASDGTLKALKGNRDAKLTTGTWEALGLSTKSELQDLWKIVQSKDDQALVNKIRYRDTTSVKAVLQDAINNAKDPALVELGKFLQKNILDDLPLSWLPDAEWKRTQGSNVLGYYIQSAHRVMMPASGKTEYSTLVHEILHSATIHKLDYGATNPNTPIGKLTKELEALRKEAIKVAKKQGKGAEKNYYLTNVYEFTAGLFSGKDRTANTGNRSIEFKELLASIPVADKNMLHALVDIVRKLFGMGAKETNAFLKSYDLLGQLVERRLDVQYNRSSGNEKLVHFQRANEYVDPVDAQVAQRESVGDVYGWGLGLENTLGGKGVSQKVKDLASRLFGTTVGYKGHGVVKRNAWDSTIQLSQSWDVQMFKGVDLRFKEFKEAGGYKWHQETKAWENFQQQVNDYVLGVEGDYDASVIKVGQQYQKVMAHVVDHINNPGLHTGEVRRGLTQREYIEVETGEKKISKPLEKNDRYIPRVGDMQKWDALVSKFGNESLEGWFAGSFKKATGATDERAARFAKWYVRTTWEGRRNRANELVDNMLKGQDREGLKTSLMDNLEIDSFEADKIIEDMFPSKATDTGAMTSNLKGRNSLDEMHKETWVDKEGNTFEIGFNDLFDTRILDRFKNYSRRMSGAVALANHLDIYKSTQIDATIAAATRVELGDGAVTEGAQAKHTEALKFAFDRVMGVPQEEVTKFKKSMEMWRKFNVVRLMGGAVFNQLVEASQIVGTVGLRSTLEATPGLRQLRRDMVTGKAPTDMLEHLENTMGGAGADFVRRMDFGENDTWVRKFGDSKMNQRLDSLDTKLGKFASGVLDKTGMTGAMVQQKRTHATALTNHFIELAHGKENTFLSKDRLAMMGMDETDFSNLKEALVRYSKDAKGEFANTKSVDFDKWQLEDPKTHADFILAVQRESRRVVQENDLAAMIPIMGSSLGQTVFQFQNFTMQAWNKSLMYGIHHADMSTFMTVMYGGLFGTLAYMGRSQLSAIGMSDDERRQFMEKRMTMGQVMANGFGRISQASLLPTLYDTTVGTMTGQPLFSGMRTTSDLSSIASNPTLAAVNSLISMQKIVRNAASDEYQTTSRDVRTWGRTVLPMSSIPPFTTILNGIAGQFPTSDKQIPD